MFLLCFQTTYCFFHPYEGEFRVVLVGNDRERDKNVSCSCGVLGAEVEFVSGQIVKELKTVGVITVMCSSGGTSHHYSTGRSVPLAERAVQFMEEVIWETRLGVR